ncbi:geranylgeranylglycerol-phosphate geranylgeranyltransferase [Aureivirga sp. CE67]|uniref:geranylgeranylglycerol-phosphate geranylgeranyltransferase n=1 Tax=Aureivirga sp. CE67 TaxID=1788983 RepID=UPI0018C90E9B|nr:geranylgeranylglycerol-phosphate geranylgeranyltransferase [Aureivirga sp. CE67]
MDLLEEAKKNTPAKKYPFYIKLFSLLSVVRGYNIAILVFAQYMASIFIFSHDRSLINILLDFHLYIIVLSTICVIASGYIINNFYDSDTDRINRPEKSKLDAIVSQKTKLSIYFTLNFIGVGISFIVSFRAALFFATYIFLIWFYSHKLKKYPLVSLFSAATLTILPFFAIFVYFKNFSYIIFTHAAFVFCILLIKELVKDLEKIKGDVVQNYKTIPIVYGEHFAKILTSLLILFAFDPIYFLFKNPEIGGMRYYFYASMGVLVLCGILLWRSKSQKQYNLIHNILKLLIIAGIFSMAFIDHDVIINKVDNLLSCL